MDVSKVRRRVITITPRVRRSRGRTVRIMAPTACCLGGKGRCVICRRIIRKASKIVGGEVGVGKRRYMRVIGDNLSGSRVVFRGGGGGRAFCGAPCKRVLVKIGAERLRISFRRSGVTIRVSCRLSMGRRPVTSYGVQVGVISGSDKGFSILDWTAEAPERF